MKIYTLHVKLKFYDILAAEQDVPIPENCNIVSEFLFIAT